jgi:phenylacetate-coenzyme A ligase PaaK-like adenylate-forming protein
MDTISEFGQVFAATAARVRANFTWYDRLLAGCGYDRDRSPLRLPYVDEAVLDEHYYSADHSGLADCATYLTSGTSGGTRKKILYSSEDHARYVEQRTKIFARLLTPECRVACADLGTGHAAASAAEIFKNLGLDTFQIDFRRPVREHVEILNARRPDVLFTMPMILDSLVHAGGLSISPRKLIVVGDVATPAWKENMTRRFGLRRGDLLDIVGSIEVGSIAYECFDCGTYHFDDHIYPEVLAPEVGGDGTGRARVLVLTSTARTVFPAVRFVTGDLVEGFGRRRCGGRDRLTFERMIGRAGGEWKHGEKISLYDISEAVNASLPGSIFDAYTDRSRVVIRVCAPDFTPEKAEEIKRLIRRRNPDVDQMIASELVGDIEVLAAAPGQLAGGGAKKNFPNDISRRGRN